MSHFSCFFVILHEPGCSCQTDKTGQNGSEWASSGRKCWQSGPKVAPGGPLLAHPGSLLRPAEPLLASLGTSLDAFNPVVGGYVQHLPLYMEFAETLLGFPRIFGTLVLHNDTEGPGYLHLGAGLPNMAELGARDGHFGTFCAKMQATRIVSVAVRHQG